MANVELKTKILLRNDIASNWTSTNPVLGKGEIGIERDTNKIKIGDGVKTWSQLDYFSGELKIDGSSIKYNDAGKLGIAGIENAGPGYTLVSDGDGGVTWSKPSETTVEGLSGLIDALDSRVTTAEGTIKKNSEDLVEVSGKVGDIEENIITINTTLNQKADKSTLDDYMTISAAENAYAKKADLNKKADTTALDEVSNRVVAIENAYVKSVTYEEGGIFKITKQDGSVSTVDLAIEKVVTNFIYNEETRSLDLTLADNTTQSVPLSAFIKAYTGKTTDDTIVTVSGNTIEAVLTDSVKENINKGIQALTQVGSLSERVDSVDEKVDANTATINTLVKDAQDIAGNTYKNEENIIVIPTATASALGLVRGSSDDNGVSIAANGKMSVNNLNVNKLFQTEGDELILNGGSASKTSL